MSIYTIYSPKTEFGKEVAATNFGRVCPKCRKKWSNKKTWLADTYKKSTVTKSVLGEFLEISGTHREFKEAIHVIKIAERVHADCEGVMLDEGECVSTKLI